MSHSSTERDVRIRQAALEWCGQLRRRWGDAVPASELRQFPFEGGSIFLYGQQGIFKPKELSDGPLSIRTSMRSRYSDEPIADGRFIHYDFRADRESDNDGLKRLCDGMTPLIYLVQVKEKPSPEYMIVAPAFIAGWDDAGRVFHVDYQPAAIDVVSDPVEPRREDALQVVKARLHQAHFRKEVLAAYRNRCAACDLRVRPLLDGAHIIPDSEPGGEPIVQNGIAFCTLHHRAFDRRLLRVTEDYRIEIATEQIRDNGSAARIALLEHDGRHLILPQDPARRPDPARLRQLLTNERLAS